MSTRRLLPREERQASIEQAAARAFGRTGFADTSMDDVAAEAGVTKVLVYRHVESKESLYRSILEQVSTDLARQFEDRRDGGLAVAGIEAHLATARRDTDGYRLLMVHAQSEPDFAAYTGEIMALIRSVGDEAFGHALDPALRSWATELLVRVQVQAVLGWLESGRPDHDDDFVRHTAAALESMTASLIDPVRGDRR